MGVLGRILAFLVMGTVAMVTIGVPFYLVCYVSMLTPYSPTDPASAWRFLLPYLLVAILAALIVGFAPTVRHAWGRMALISGIGCFALPFSPEPSLGWWALRFSKRPSSTLATRRLHSRSRGSPLPGRHG